MSDLKSFRGIFFARLGLAGLVVLFSYVSQPTVSAQTPNIALKGSLASSITDGVDVFSGKLEKVLPLLNLQGRGDISQAFYLPLRNSEWRVMETASSENYGGSKKYYYYRADQTNYVNNYMRAGYSTLGKLEVETKFSGWMMWETPSVTEVRFTSNSGAIVAFRDTLTNGQSYESRARGCVMSGFQPPNPPPACSRGRVFRSIDGSNATFVADADIYDMIFWDAFGNPTPYTSQNNVAGTLFLSDGSRIRFENSFNNITKITDRNGNYMTFEYDTQLGYTYNFLKKVTDSLNREVNIVYGDATQPNYFDEIVYKGFGGTEQRIRINYTAIENVMYPGQSLGVALFPGVHTRCYYLSSGEPCDPTPGGGVPGAHYATSIVVPSSIVLANNTQYQFYYNNYLELARLRYPTGAYTDYTYDGLIGAGADGFSEPVYAGGGDIYRRISSIKTFNDSGQLIIEKTFSNIPQFVTQSHPAYPLLDNVLVDVKNGDGAVVSRTKSYFYDSVASQGFYTFLPASFGKEYKTEVLDPVSDSVLLKTEMKFEQRESFQWCTGTFWSIYVCDPNNPLSQPEVDTRMTEIKTTLETGLVSKKTFNYDQYNNISDTYEYDYGTGQPGSLLRRAHSLYITDPNYIDYTTGSTLLRLPFQTWVSSDLEGNNKTSFAQFEYDNYGSDTNHAALVPRVNVSGFDTNYHTGYTRRGNATAITNFANAQNQTQPVVEYSQYDILGNVVKGIDGRGVVSTIDYSDRFGTPNGEARGNWDTVTMPAQLAGKSTFAFATSTTNSFGHTSYSQFDYSTSLAIDLEDANAKVTTTFYNDSMSRPTLITRPDGGTTTYSYNDTPGNRYVEKQVKQDATRNQTNRQYLDGLGQTIRGYTYDGVGTTPWIAVATEYDALGRVYRVSNPYRTGTNSLSEPVNPSSVWTTTAYDPFNRVASVTMADGSQVSTVFTGNVALVTDQAGKQRQSITDALGRQTQVIENPNGSAFQTIYTFDTLGNVRVVDQGSQHRYFMYDSLSRLVRVRNPELDPKPSYNLLDPVSGNSDWSIVYSYDADDNLASKSDARGVVCTYVYDNLNRLVTSSYSDGTPTVTNSYDAAGVANSKGRRTSVSSSVSPYNITGYDAMGRVTGSSQVIDGQTYSMGYTYDLVDDLLTQTYPSGRVVTTNYDTAGRISNLTGQIGATTKTYASEFNYTPHSAIASFHLGNGLWEHANFNSRLQPTEIGLGGTPTGVDKLQLGYDYGTTNNNGSILSASIVLPGLSVNQTFGYDPLGRLLSAEERNSSNSVNWKQTYSYDRFGNNQIVNYDVYSNPIPGPAINSNTNRITDGQGYSYDAMGNVATSPGANALGYDAEGRQVSFNNGLTTYGYDGDGRRVKKIDGSGAATTVFVYNIANQIVAEYANFGSSSQAASKFMTMDSVGSVRAITDGNGQMLSRRDYLPFGEDAGARGGRTPQIGYAGDNTRQQFTGYERDSENTLDYAQARYYASALGRFNSVDPIAGSIFDPQSLNKYSYVGNDPLNRTDPDGQYPRSQHKFITFLLAVLAGRADAAEIARGADEADNFFNAASGLFGLGWIINFNKHFGVPPTAAELQGLSGYKLGFALHLVEDNSKGAPHDLGGGTSLGARIKSSFIHVIRNIKGNSPDTDPNRQAGWEAAWGMLSKGPYAKQLVEFITSTVNKRGLTIVGMQIIQPNGKGGYTTNQLGWVDLSKAKLISTSTDKNGFIVNIWQLQTKSPWDDPNVQQILRNFSMPGSDPVEEAEALYIYWLPWPVN